MDLNVELSVAAKMAELGLAIALPLSRDTSTNSIPSGFLMATLAACAQNAQSIPSTFRLHARSSAEPVAGTMRSRATRLEPAEANQYKITKRPSGREIGSAKLQTGMPGARPLADVGRADESNICHAKEPPRAHAVPSVQTNRTSPRS